MQTLLDIVADIADLAFVLALLLGLPAILLRRMRHFSSRTLKICVVIWLIHIWINCSMVAIAQWPTLGVILAVPLVALLLPVTLLLLLIHGSWMMLLSVLSTLALSAAARILASYFDDHPDRPATTGASVPSPETTMEEAVEQARITTESVAQRYRDDDPDWEVPY